MQDAQAKRPPLQHVNIRISAEVRKEVQDLAKAESTELIEVTEGHIYRRAIEFFLHQSDTKRLHNPIDKLSDEGGDHQSVN